MAGKKKLSDEDRVEIRRLNKTEGLSYAAIAKQYNVSYQTILRVCNPDKYEENKKKNIEYNKRIKDNLARAKKENQRTFRVILTKSIDGDIIQHLDATENVNGYLRELIRKDMGNPVPTKEKVSQ